MSEANYNNVCDNFDSCAIAGAAAFVAGIPDSHILVNGPLWCYFYAKGHLKRANSSIMERMTGSQPDTTAVIFGGQEFLKEELERLCKLDNFKPSVLFVENSCAFSLIGDDTEGILREMALPFPSVSIDCGGLLGNFAEGYERAFLECFKSLKIAKTPKLPGTINLLGTTEYYLHGKEDKEEMVRLLELAGYEVLTCPGNGSSWEELHRLGQASLNLVVNEELALKAAQKIEKELGIPYLVVGMPYGLKGTFAWLEKIHAVLPARSLEKLKAEIENTRKKAIDILEDYSCYWGNMWYDEVLIAAPGAQALAMAEALRTEWLDTGKLTVIALTSLKENIYSSCCDQLVSLKELQDWYKYVPPQGRVLLLGSNNEQINLLREGYENVDYHSIAYPLHEEVFLVDFPLAGIKGALHFQQLLWNKYMQANLKPQEKMELP